MLEELFLLFLTHAFELLVELLELVGVVEGEVVLVILHVLLRIQPLSLHIVSESLGLGP